MSERLAKQFLTRKPEYVVHKLLQDIVFDNSCVIREFHQNQFEGLC